MSISTPACHISCPDAGSIRLRDVVNLTTITITFTLNPPIALLIFLFDAPCESTRVFSRSPAELLR